MTEDARFEDGGETPLYLKAQDAEDLGVISALAQDSVIPIGEISYDPKARRFAMLLNRFRWEDAKNAETRGRPVERVQSVLVFDDVLSAQSMGVSASEEGMIISIMSITYEAGKDGTGRAEITLSGDGAISLSLEAIEVSLKDVTRPYLAPSGLTPEHR